MSLQFSLSSVRNTEDQNCSHSSRSRSELLQRFRTNQWARRMSEAHFCLTRACSCRPAPSKNRPQLMRTVRWRIADVCTVTLKPRPVWAVCVSASMVGLRRGVPEEQ